MDRPTSSVGLTEADREKRTVAVSSLLAAFALTGMKVAVGLWTNSLGILSEAAHSGLDLVAAGVTLWAVRISGQPADHEHTYGHGKFENLSALFETLLLLATCVWIISEAASRLFFEERVHVDANVWAFLVVLVSIGIDYSRSRALSRVARKHESQALEADALHFSTDIWSSAVVLLGLVGVLLAGRLEMPWLENADSVAALGVALLVIWVSFRLGRKSIDDLLDRVPQGLQEEIRRVAAVSGVQEVKLVRVRRSGPEVFTDVTLTVDRGTPLGNAHEVADRAEAAVRAILPRADVVIHVEPVARAEEDVATTVRVLAAGRGLGSHGIRVCQEGGQRTLELHLEVADTLSLGDAHRQATEFERALGDAIPGLSKIVTHIEPVGGESPSLKVEPSSQIAVLSAIEEFVQESGFRARAHELSVQESGGELTVWLHCLLDARLAIVDAHRYTEQLEKHLHHRIANIGRVVIHVEPATDSNDEPEREETSQAT